MRRAVESLHQSYMPDLLAPFNSASVSSVLSVVKPFRLFDRMLRGATVSADL